jgi:uncharacterized protein
MTKMNTLHENAADFTTGEFTDTDIEEIAHVLAITNRFGGHTQVPYSVAQHSVEVSMHVRPELALEGLLHDAGEVYIGDVVGPLKELFPMLSMIEERFMKPIRKMFCLSTNPKDWAEVMHADRRVLLTEMQSPLIYKTYELIRWKAGQGPYEGETITPVEDWAIAKLDFLERFDQLWAERCATAVK